MCYLSFQCGMNDKGITYVILVYDEGISVISNKFYCVRFTLPLP